VFTDAAGDSLGRNRQIGQMYGAPSAPQLDRATGCMQLSHIFAVEFRCQTGIEGALKGQTN
jgi:hypothetical protein